MMCTLPEVASSTKAHFQRHVLWYQILWIPFILLVGAFVTARNRTSPMATKAKIGFAYLSWMLLSFELCVWESAVNPFTIVQTVYTITILMTLQSIFHAIFKPAPAWLISAQNLVVVIAMTILYHFVWTISDWTAGVAIIGISLAFCSFVNYYMHYQEALPMETMEMYFSLTCYMVQFIWLNKNHRKIRKEQKVVVADV